MVVARRRVHLRLRLGMGQVREVPDRCPGAVRGVWAISHEVRTSPGTNTKLRAELGPDQMWRFAGSAMSAPPTTNP